MTSPAPSRTPPPATEGSATQLPAPPPYGERTLADVTPSVLAAIGTPGFVDTLGLPTAERACVLLIDGLGWHNVLAAEDVAPGLAERARARAPLQVGFPATTAASVASIGTGLPPGQHGVVGYQLPLDGEPRPMNLLTWSLHGDPPDTLLERLPPESFQPAPPAFERARSAGVAVETVIPMFPASGLSRAVMRGAEVHHTVSLGDVAASTVGRLSAAAPRLVYSYHPDLDTTGHLRGWRSPAWRYELANVERLVAAIAEQLPRGSLLVVIGDHGMLDIAPDDRIDLDRRDDLRDGVRVVGGDARVRYLAVHHGRVDQVAERWRAALDDRAWVVGRDEAVAAGWFGPDVTARTRARIGDLVVVARDPIAIVESERDPDQTALIGMHGALTPEEQLVPLVVVAT